MVVINTHQSLSCMFLTNTHTITFFFERTIPRVLTSFHRGTSIHLSFEIPHKNEENAWDALNRGYIKSNTMAVNQTSGYSSICTGRKD
jgi:hypothetical protein